MSETNEWLFVFGLLLAVVFGRIRIHYLAYYSARTEYEYNIRHSPTSQWTSGKQMAKLNKLENCSITFRINSASVADDGKRLKQIGWEAVNSQHLNQTKIKNSINYISRCSVLGCIERMHVMWTIVTNFPIAWCVCQSVCRCVCTLQKLLHWLRFCLGRDSWGIIWWSRFPPWIWCGLH